MKKLLTLTLLACLSGLVLADSGYQNPPKLMADLVDAPRRPGATISPDKVWVALLQRPGAPSISELAQPEEKLAGLKINSAIFAPSRSRGYTGITLRQLQGDGKVVLNDLPKGKIMNVSFSPDSKNLAFVLENSKGLSLWNYNLKKKKVKRVSKSYINASLGGSKYRWKRNSKGFYTRVTVSSANQKPKASLENIEPVIQITSGQKAAVRTYSNLLKTPQDEALFEFLATSQIAEISLKGKVKKLGKPGMFRSYEQSPNGKYLLVAQYQKPFSYLVPAYRFPLLTEVWDTQGKLVKQVANLPSGENIPKGFDSVREGRRSIAWRSDKAATLVWAEALDGGDMKKSVAFHDSVHTWKAPFTKPAELLQKVERRYAGIEWGNKDFAIISDWRFSDRQYRAWKFSPDNPNAEKVIFEQRSYNDRYKDPGRFVYHKNQFGVDVIKVQGNNNKVLLTGRGASPKGNIPFMDEYDFSSQKKKRLWKSEAPYYERVVVTISDDATKVLTLRESQSEQPNFFIRDIKNKKLSQFTQFPHPSPAFKGIKKELIKYKRKDGVELSGTLYLPPNYDEKQGRLPVLMWAYPLEYKDKSVASQVTDSPYEFVRVSYWGPLPHLAQGFAVFDDPKMPIIGADDDLPNDTFRKQLVDSAEAAVKVLVDKGIADPDRIAIAGHSYGAFMVANLLAHSDLFKAGIARSGAYNRTLTPFGFQGEERSFWEGQAVYSNMSPFFHAEKIDEPMLMIHGKEDPNSGTFPMQSERMFAAMKGLGGNARLVMLPHEQHGYRARESLLHLLWEQHEWLEKYVKPTTVKSAKN
ncbi:alpha/beta hydrolase family protein [Aliikangiella coralliicola]|uniref:S9 family peptidase n=1 Tax=Aliikangiella coralliicola TaxID=2592383 RepID=A0A545UH92_9GAMM|nr:prolyl oligopeptidase family serine peptidase [Aliikangiella coralliicola]TQV88830.1 S9 family peptidase [Aliikangiella coralliicola]